MVWPTANIPTYGRGVWLECNGQSFSRTQFPQLYEALGRTTVPDFRNRFLVSAGGKYSVGNTGGLDSVTLSESQMPSHNHVINYYYAIPTILNDMVYGIENSGVSPNYFGSTYKDWILFGGYKNIEDAKTDNEYSIRYSETGGDESSLIAIDNETNSSYTGGGQSHENRPPYIAVKWMIKAK